MEFSRKFAAFPRKKQIAIVVWSVHFLIVFCLAFHHLVTRSFSKPRPIIVRTFEPSAPKPAIQVQKTAPSAPAKKAEKSNPPTAKAVSKAKPKQTAKKAAPKPIESALEEIAKSLDAVAPAEPSKRSTLSLPAKIEPVAHLAEESRASPEYADFLITYLQHSLDLPEHGDVRAEIRIDRFGNLIEIGRASCRERV